jgi:ABC-type lipoprotein release transport system permease subunit
LAAFVALLGVASLGHVLLTTLWRRGGELATLRCLGFTRSQTIRCMIWQAMTIALVSVAIGVPLGLVAGRAAWFAVTDPIGVATDPSRPLVVILAAGLTALVVAALVALGPGWRAARLRPVEALRSE